MQNIIIRQLIGHNEYLECLRIQRETWGENFMEVVSPAIQKVSQTLGGVTAGAFDESGMMLGFVFGMTGLKYGKPVHWSDMLAVRPEWRGKGVGRKLKLFQRDEVRKLGVETMYWTYDPLEAVNAYLNLNRLGARVSEYVENMYATDEGSTLHAGLGMDRFIVQWNLKEERVERALSEETLPIEEQAHSAPVLNTSITGTGEVVPVEGELVDAPVIRVEIPSDIQNMKNKSPNAGSGWRLNTRRVFKHYLSRRYEVDAVYREREVDRCYYILKKVS
jgi:predicted GNAT superfamily acetyltransferase